MYCNKCGKQIDDNSMFCSRCGQRIVQLADCQSNPENNYYYPSKSKKTLIFSIIGLALSAISNILVTLLFCEYEESVVGITILLAISSIPFATIGLFTSLFSNNKLAKIFSMIALPVGLISAFASLILLGY